MEIQNININNVKPYEKNTKKHPKQQIDNICESLKQFGWQQPIVVDKDNVIIVGHGRYFASLKLGYKEVPCVVADNLTPEQVKKYRLLDNKLNESEWDFDFLLGEIDGLSFDGFNVNWDIPEQTEDNVEVVEVDVPDVPEETDIKLGDIYQLGEHFLMCGDSTSEEDVAKLMDGVKADMVFTDPPYGMKKENEGVLNDNLNYDDLLEFNKKWIPLTFKELKENGSWYCWGIDEPLMDIYSNILKPMKKLVGQNKLTFRNLITWDKGIGQGQLSPDYRMFPIADEKCLFVMRGRQTYGETIDDYWEGFEPIRIALVNMRDRIGLTTQEVCKYAEASTCSHWYSKSQWEFPSVERFGVFVDNIYKAGIVDQQEFEKIKQEFEKIKQEWYSTRAYFDNTHDNMNDVWHFSKTMGEERESAGGHATPKPIALCSRAIKSSSREGEIVLDLFGGSGSTLIACEQLKRKCYMMELDPHYCGVIIKRWEDFTNKKAIKIGG